jgi:TRAP-type C4-dicarboxylate transport system substrate-binding protein
MMKRIGIMITVLCFIFGGLYFMSSTAVLAKEPIKLTYSNFFPPTHVQSQLAESWIKEVEKRTNGAVKITYFPGGALLKGPEIYDGILKGVSDIGMSVLGYTRGRFPAMEFIDLPMGYPNGKVATCVINEFYKKFKLKEFDDVKVFYFMAHGPGIIQSKKPVNKLEDLKGMKIRTYGFGTKIIQGLGAVPVSMGQGQAYEALQKGVVEATLVPSEALKGWKQAEVIKYTIECYSIGYTAGFFIAMNKKKWESLPENVQKVFDEVSAEWIPKHGEAWDTSDKEGIKFSLSLGNKVIPLSKKENARWANALKPVIDGFAKEAEAKGIPGREYVKGIRSLIEECGKK